MEKDLKEFIKKISKEQAKSLVGKACSQIEVLQKQSNLSSETKNILGLQKDLLKELIYQEFRTLCNSVIFYSEGREYKNFPIYNPSKKEL